MKANDIREFSVEEIGKKLRDSREELVNLRIRKQADQIENPAHIRTLRRDIARCETILKQKHAAATA